ncbi:hypothetical protein, partial [Bifidobacterium longum]|uniref:hypothetical protein n=1 Tax=Bifidobacterium longum TaxID=216816 RepID=UPI001E4CE948
LLCSAEQSYSALIDDWLFVARTGESVRAFFHGFCEEGTCSREPVFPYSRVPVLPGNTSGFFVDAMLRGSACRL